MKKTFKQNHLSSLRIKRSISKLTITVLTLFLFNTAYSQYYWQVMRIDTFTGGQSYCIDNSANPLNLNLIQCAGGGSKPDYFTNYTLSWYVSSTDSSGGGVLVSSGYMTTIRSYTVTQSITPATNKLGVFYYYAVLSDPSMSGCGFSNSLISKTQKVVINGSTGTDIQTACDSFKWIDGNTYTESNNTATFKIAGGAASGCDSIVTLNLTINKVNIETDVNGFTITSKDSGAAYQWLDCNKGMGIITGEISQSYTATANGNYAVKITKAGCVDTSVCVPIINIGIIENSFNDKFICYPNPTRGHLTIKFDDSQNNLIVRLLSVTGELLESKSFNDSQMIDFEITQPKGLYFIEITNSNNNKAVLSVVKE